MKLTQFYKTTAGASEIDSFLYKRSSLDVFQLWIDLGLAKSAETRPRVHGSKVQRDTESGSVAGSGAQPLLDTWNNNTNKNKNSPHQLAWCTSVLDKQHFGS